MQGNGRVYDDKDKERYTRKSRDYDDEERYTW